MIFISYRRADSESVVGRIDSELKKHFPMQDVFSGPLAAMLTGGGSR
jgi:hypothetical protein